MHDFFGAGEIKQKKKKEEKFTTFFDARARRLCHNLSTDKKLATAEEEEIIFQSDA